MLKSCPVHKFFEVDDDCDDGKGDDDNAGDNSADDTDDFQYIYSLRQDVGLQDRSYFEIMLKCLFWNHS